MADHKIDDDIREAQKKTNVDIFVQSIKTYGSSSFDLKRENRILKLPYKYEIKE